MDTGDSAIEHVADGGGLASEGVFAKSPFEK